MDLATGAMGSLLPKLVELLNDKYKLQKGVKEGVTSLQKEMKSMQAALRKLAEVPQDQLDEHVKLWVGEVRELSFDMEDLIDKFLVCVDDGSETTTKSNKLKRLTEKMTSLFTKEIADKIKDINKQVQDVANRCGRYTVDTIIARPTAVTTIDSRLGAMYKEVNELVGIVGKRDQELMKMLSEGDDDTKSKLKVVSVVGFGGLGKTTYIGQNDAARKVFMHILVGLDIFKPN